MAAADPGTRFSMLGGELKAEAGLYCLGREMWPTTSLFFMLLCTAALCLMSAASAAPQLTWAIGLKGLGGLQPPLGKIIQLVGMKIEPLSAQ